MSENNKNRYFGRSALKNSTLNLAVIAMLTALLVVLALYCTIKTQALKITLDFIPVMIAAITGVVFGLMLKDNSLKTTKDKLKALFSVVIAQFGISAFITPLWLNMLYGTSYGTFFITRIPQIAIMTAVQLIFIPVMVKIIDGAGIKKKIMNN